MARRWDEGLLDRTQGVAIALQSEIDEMWDALAEWAGAADPPARWRPDIGLMANETVRRIAWLVEQDPAASACWHVFAQHVLAASAAEREPQGD